MSRKQSSDVIVIDSDDDSDTLWICFDRDDWFGTQNYTCSGCLNHFCYDENCSASFVNWRKVDCGDMIRLAP